MRYFQNVESILRLYMPQAVLFIRPRVAVFLFQLGIQERNRTIRADGVTVIVRGVVSECPKSKRVTVKVLGIPQKSQDKVSAPHIVRQVAEEETSVRVITHVLDDGPAVGVAVRFFDFSSRRTGKTLQQQGAYVGVPYAVNDRFMRKDGVGRGLTWPAQREDQRHNDGEGSHRKSLAAPHSAHSNLAVILARFLSSSEFV